MAKRLYIVGVCGTFMAGIATLAKQLGYEVRGCDHGVYPPMSDYLAEQGIDVHEGFNPQDLIDTEPDEIVIANAISRNNAVLEYVLNQRLSYQSAPAWLAANVLQDREVIAVTGTHGKTTTTSLLTWILQTANLKPGYLIAGKVNQLATTASVGEGKYFVIEADEYDSAFDDKRPKFMHYHSSKLIIHNLEFDHADIYDDFSAIQKQFRWLLRTVPGNGQIYLAADDENVQETVQEHAYSPIVSYGIEQGDFQAKLKKPDGSEFIIYQNNQEKVTVAWSQIGVHNVKNALAASVVALSLGVKAADIAAALASFNGVERRMMHYGQAAEIDIFDDFAHHPTAINEAISALRKKVGNEKRIIAVVEMASNTMQKGVHDEVMAQAVSSADYAILLSNNPSGNLQAKTEKNQKIIIVNNTVQAALEQLQHILQAGDQVLFMSNRATLQLPQQLMEMLTES